MGGVNAQMLPGQRVIFKNGTVATIYHEKIKDRKELDWSKLYLDGGAASLEQAGERVRVGDVATLHQPFVNLGKRYMAKAMDDRSAVPFSWRRGGCPRSLPQGSALSSRAGRGGAARRYHRGLPAQARLRFCCRRDRGGRYTEAPLMAEPGGKRRIVMDRSVLSHRWCAI